MTDNSASKPKALVIGIGNEHRADDAFGLFVARRLHEVLPSHVTVTEHHGEGASLMEEWQGYSTVILVDAVRSNAVPGTLYRIDASATKVPARFFHYSSHDFGLAEAIEMTRILGNLPLKLIVFGAEGARFELGGAMSSVLEAQIATVVDQVVAELEAPVRA